MHKLTPQTQFTAFERMNMNLLQNVEYDSCKSAAQYNNGHVFNPRLHEHKCKYACKEHHHHHSEEAINPEASCSNKEEQPCSNKETHQALDRRCALLDNITLSLDPCGCAALEDIHVQPDVIKNETNPMHQDKEKKAVRMFRSLLRKDVSAKW